jgi:hypothetical protein
LNRKVNEHPEVRAMEKNQRRDEQMVTDGDEEMDIQQAALVLEQARAKAQHELSASHLAISVTWALVYLIGYGAIWLSVRGQHPFQGPASGALLGLFLLVGVAMAVTATVVSRATSGVGGASDVRRRMSYLAVAVGIVGVLVLESVLDHAGASRSVLGVYGAAAPILLIGLVVAAGSVARMDWRAFGLGVWLIAAAALSGLAGPAGVWGVLALAVAAGFLALTAIGIRRSRS